MTKSAPRVTLDNKLMSRIMQMVANIQNLHNGYLEKHRSVFTDSFSLRPYMLDRELRRQRRQPKYIKTGDVVTMEKIAPAIESDRGTYAMRSATFQSCGGFRYRKLASFLVTASLSGVLMS